MGLFGSDTVINIPDVPAAKYGRNPAGAGTARNEWWKRAEANDRQQGQVQGGASYANQQASVDRGPQATEDVRLAQNQASGANGNQAGAIGLAGALARGQGPSEAAYQLQSGLTQGSNLQTSLGRSGRGSAALATAGGNTQAGTANLQQNAFLQAGALKAQDMATGRGLYGSLVGTQREQDTARIGQANEMGQSNASRNDKYALDMGNAAVGMGKVGNVQSGMDLSNYQQGMNPINAQTEAEQAAQSWRNNRQKQIDSMNVEAGNYGEEFSPSDEP